MESSTEDNSKDIVVMEFAYDAPFPEGFVEKLQETFSYGEIQVMAPNKVALVLPTNTALQVWCDGVMKEFTNMLELELEYAEWKKNHNIQ